MTFTAQASTPVATSSLKGEMIVQALHPTYSVATAQAHLPAIVTATDLVTLKSHSYMCEVAGGQVVCGDL